MEWRVSAGMEVRGPLTTGSLLILLCGFCELNSGCPPCLQTPSLAISEHNYMF